MSEAKRLLERFRAITPHDVQSTVNLYATRHRILGMAQPMAAIAEAIRSTVMVNADDILELTKNEMRRRDLVTLLRVEVKTLRASKVARPRTTCSHEDCVDHDTTSVEGIDGKAILKTVYKAACHDSCYLANIKLDDPSLRNCWAMNGEDCCRICSHHWMPHLHINYTIEEQTKQINDPDVERTL